MLNKFSIIDSYHIHFAAIFILLIKVKYGCFKTLHFDGKSLHISHILGNLTTRFTISEKPINTVTEWCHVFPIL